MTIPELITTVLQVLRNQFYGNERPGAFERDERYLIAAIATYGHECRDRGWHFDAPAIQREVLGILMAFKRSGVEIQWMPVYLQNSIRRHIGQRAEELQAAARCMKRNTARIVDGVTPVAIVEKTDTELLALHYADLRKLRRQARAQGRRPVKNVQPSLL
jgi:hypothetical protein